MPKNTKQFSTAPEKQSVVSQKQSVVSQKQSVVSQKQSVVSQKQSVVYTSSQCKMKLKSSRDREIEHTGLYWFTLNQELHPVFPETTGESTKQATLDYLQHHHQRSDLDPLKTHTSFGSAQTPLRMLILTTSRTHNTSQLHTQNFFKVQKDYYTCYKKIWNQYKMKILFHTLLIQAISKQTSTLQKQNQWKTQICFSLNKTQFSFVT